MLMVIEPSHAPLQVTFVVLEVPGNGQIVVPISEMKFGLVGIFGRQFTGLPLAYNSHKPSGKYGRHEILLAKQARVIRPIGNEGSNDRLQFPTFRSKIKGGKTARVDKLGLSFNVMLSREAGREEITVI